MNEDSSILWSRRLGHISIDIIKRLVNDGVLSTLVERRNGVVERRNMALLDMVVAC